MSLRIAVKNADNTHEYEELVKVFLRPGEYEMAPLGSDGAGCGIVTELEGDKNICKQEIYTELSRITGRKPPWGIITGIRPVKLFGDLVRSEGSEEAADRKFREYFFVSPEKTALTRRIYGLQQARFGEAADDSAGIYAGIPFCPTRCLYCSFASNPITGADVEAYLEALAKEIDASSAMMRRAGYFAESVYIGGGTPTSLTAEQLDALLGRMEKGFMSERTIEATVEAGRPDTIDEAKLDVIAKHGFSRISINPQSMKEETLRRIGRDHTPDDVRRAFRMAAKVSKEDGRVINADVIAGLPGEDTEDIKATIAEMIELGADNITVHSLAVKRTSRLKEEDPEYHYKRGEEVSRMLEAAGGMLEDNGYVPYYLYRQKHMSGALENVGYALPGTESLYNVRIMDEHQSILAMGAGAIGKAYDPRTRQLARVPDVKDYKVYIDRIDEMIRRKEEMMF